MRGGPRRILLAGHSEGAILAAALAARGVPTSGVVLLSMSATPGEELLRWRDAGSLNDDGLRVLLTSGYTNEALAGDYGVPGHVPVLAKPYDPDELTAALARLCA